MRAALLTIALTGTCAALALGFQEPSPATTPAVAQPPAVDPVLLHAPKTRADVDQRMQLARERLAALQPTTQPATQPVDELTAQFLESRVASYREWEGYVGQLQRIVALQDGLAALSSEARIQELSAELQTLQDQTAALAQQPAPLTADAEIVAEVTARHKDFEGRLTALSELQTRRAAQLATGFKSQREGLEARLRELRQQRAEFQTTMDAAPTTAPADRELLDLRRCRLDVQIAQQELNLLGLTLETEQTQLLHKQDERRTELLTRYVGVLRKRMTALADARSRSELESLALRRQQATQPHEQALLDLQYFRESVLVHYFRNRNLLNALKNRFPPGDFNRLSDRVTASRAMLDETLGTEQTPGSLAFRTGREVLLLRREAQRERREFTQILTRLRLKLGQTVARLHELQTGRERARERFNELAQRALTAAAGAEGAERTRIETEVTSLRSALEQNVSVTVAEATEVVGRLRGAVELIGGHLRRLASAEEVLYWTALKRRESGLAGLDWSTIRRELRQLLGTPPAAPPPTTGDEPSLTAAGIAPAAPDVRAQLADQLNVFRGDLDNLRRKWPLGLALVVAGCAAGWLLRWVARRRAARVLERMAAAAETPDPETGQPGKQFSGRTDLLIWRIVADVVLFGVVILTLWATAALADVSRRTLLPVGTLLLSILAAYALLRFIRHLFDRRQRRRVFPCDDQVARHYLCWGRTLAILAIALLPLCMLLSVMDLLAGVRALLYEAWQTGALLIMLGFLVRKQRVIGLVSTSPGNWRHVAVATVYPFVFAAVLGLLGLQAAGYGVLVEYLATGVLASAASLVVVSGVVEYVCDLLNRYVQPVSGGPGGSRGRRARARRQPPTSGPSADAGAAVGTEDLPRPGGFVIRLIQSLLRLAGLVAIVVLIMKVWGAGGYLESIPWQKSTLGALAITGALLLDRVLVTALTAFHVAGRIPVSTANMIRRWSRGLLTTIVLLLLFALAGAPVEVLWAPLSALLGLIAIGFVAVWSMLSNILATVIILVWRPFNIGEHIEVQPEGIAGTVIDINFMYTLLKSEEGARTTVPNSLFVQKFVRRQKLTRPPQRSLAEQLAADKPVGE